MNYLSHFYIHQKPGESYYNAGLIMPDLARGFVKSFKNKVLYVGSDLQALHIGCLQHYNADKTFHASEFFEWGSHLCTAAVKKLIFKGEVERRWFIGHVLFEMFLDKLLVQHKKQVYIDFYESLNQTDLLVLKEFLDLNTASNSDKLLQNFNHFRSVQYIINYTNTNLFVFSLSRVLIRAGLKPLSFYDKMILEECVLKLEDTEFRDVYTILLKLKQVFG